MGNKAKILLTGFEPFNGKDYNVSKDVLASIRPSADMDIITVVLPVDYAKAEAELRQIIAKEKPDYVISMGEAGDDHYGMRIETVGKNHTKYFIEEAKFNLQIPPDMFISIPDSMEASIHNTNQTLNQVFETAFNKRFSGEEGVISLSENAGSFVCDHSFFTALSSMNDIGKPGQITFLHLNDATHTEIIPLPYSGIRIVHKESDGLSYEDAIQRYAAVVSEGIDYIAKHHTELAKQTVTNCFTEGELALQNARAEAASITLQCETGYAHLPKGQWLAPSASPSGIFDPLSIITRR